MPNSLAQTRLLFGADGMTNPDHVEILRRGPRAWNSWRAEHPSLVPQLDDAALALGERQLGPINGGPMNLRSASMQRAFLRSATLTGADLEGADLTGANLAYARLNHANLTKANLSGAILDHADFRGAVLTGANLSGASLMHAQNLTQGQINEAICKTATILPEHLQPPASRLETVRKPVADEPLSPVRSRHVLS
jgi:hypothetical protein